MGKKRYEEYTKEMLVADFNRCMKDKGRVPFRYEMCNKDGYISHTVYRYVYGSWKQALIEFGVIKQYTPDELVAAIHRSIKENNKVPLGHDMQQCKGYPSERLFIECYGCWNNALIAAGVECNRGTYTKLDLINILKKYYNEFNEVPTEHGIDKKPGYPSSQPFLSQFENWNAALKAAGLPINNNWHRNDGTEECSICHTKKTINWYYNDDNKMVCNKCIKLKRKFVHGTTDPNSSVGIGIITEHLVYKILGDCIKCNTLDSFCSPYDLISTKYKTINVKSSKLILTNKNSNSLSWAFDKHRNVTIPDHYICIGFDKNRSTILGVWIVPSSAPIINKSGIHITNSSRGLSRASQYEVDPTPYNDLYQSLDITTLPEFRNYKGDTHEI